MVATCPQGGEEAGQGSQGDNTGPDVQSPKHGGLAWVIGSKEVSGNQDVCSPTWAA